jgi:AcrR family transcriptional regulator
MRPKEKMETVYAVSLKVFAEYGFKKTTVEDIAAQLGMTKGNLYLYAANKQELYRETVAYALLRWQGLVRQRVEQEVDAKNKFLVMCHKAVEYLSRDNDLRRVLVRDPDIFPMFPENDPFQEINRGSQAMIRNILEQGIREGQFRRVDTDRAAEVFFSIYKMFIIRAYIKAEDQQIQQMFQDTVELLTQGLFLQEDSAPTTLTQGE